MANVDNAVGFIPIKHASGGEIRMVPYAIASAYGTALGKGDPVELTGDGGTVYQYIQKAAAANIDNIGIFAGVFYTDSIGNPIFTEYWTASTVTKGSADAIALVWQDPQIIFRVQADTVATTDVGLLADWDSGTPSATTRLSGIELAASGGATTGRSMRILGLSNIPNNAYGAYAKVDVAWAEHALLTGAAGAGGV